MTIFYKAVKREDYPIATIESMLANTYTIFIKQYANYCF